VIDGWNVQMEPDQTINTWEGCAPRGWEKVALVSKTANSTAFAKKKSRFRNLLGFSLPRKKSQQNCVQTLNGCVHTPKLGDFWSGLHSVEALVMRVNALSRMKCISVNAVRDRLP